MESDFLQNEQNVHVTLNLMLVLINYNEALMNCTKQNIFVMVCFQIQQDPEDSGHAMGVWQRVATRHQI